MRRRLSRLALWVGLVLALVGGGIGHVLPILATPASVHAAHDAEGCCPGIAVADCRDMHGTHVCCLLPEASALDDACSGPGPRWWHSASLRAIVVAPQPRPPNSFVA